jgi:hypothetical protein
VEVEEHRLACLRPSLPVSDSRLDMLRRLSPQAETVRFEDRAANVTGGAQGIGKSIAAAFVTLICPSASPERQVWPVRCREFMVRLAPARDQLGLALTRAQAC